MTGTDDLLTMGEVSRTLARLERGQEAQTQKIDTVLTLYVTRNEWDQRNKAVDGRLDGIDADIASRHVSWPAVVAAVVAAAALALTLLQMVP